MGVCRLPSSNSKILWSDFPWNKPSELGDSRPSKCPHCGGHCNSASLGLYLGKKKPRYGRPRMNYHLPTLTCISIYIYIYMIYIYIYAAYIYIYIAYIRSFYYSLEQTLKPVLCVYCMSPIYWLVAIGRKHLKQVRSFPRRSKLACGKSNLANWKIPDDISYRYRVIIYKELIYSGWWF